MFLESLTCSASSFITLTYNDQHLPVDYSLDPDHSKRFMYRLRTALAPKRVRFFLCGEYGDQTKRPHYHACLFNVGFEDWSTVAASWKKGFVHTGDFNETTAQYVSGYVTKKMTSHADPRLEGRYPEFSRQSNRPGIGAPAIPVLADQIHTFDGLDSLVDGDVPRALNVGRRSIPLGRYLRSKLREEMGFSDVQKDEIKRRFFEEKAQEWLLALRSDQTFYEKYPGGYKDYLVTANQGKIWSIEGKSKLSNLRRYL